MAGADKDAKCIYGKTALQWLDLVKKQEGPDKLLEDARKILLEEANCLTVLAIKGSYAKQERSILILMIYFILMALTFIWSEFTVYEVLRA